MAHGAAVKPILGAVRTAPGGLLFSSTVLFPELRAKATCLQEFLRCDPAVNFIAVSFAGKITARIFFMHLLVAPVGPGLHGPRTSKEGSDGAPEASSQWPPAPCGVTSPKDTAELVSRGAPSSAVSMGPCDRLRAHPG